MPDRVRTIELYVLARARPCTYDRIVRLDEHEQNETFRSVLGTSLDVLLDAEGTMVIY